MSLLDSVLKAATGAAPALDGSQSSLASAALSMLSSSQTGGISGLAEQFAAQGLGHIISSWIGTGQNLPISAEQLQSVLGSQQVQAIAAKVGLSPEAVNVGLAQVLPQIVDHLTPNGQVPQGDLMAKGLEILKGKFQT
jgi:uncharacterized protein YidB (DUF937 family)